MNFAKNSKKSILSSDTLSTINRSAGVGRSIVYYLLQGYIRIRFDL